MGAAKIGKIMKKLAKWIIGILLIGFCMFAIAQLQSIGQPRMPAACEFKEVYATKNGFYILQAKHPNQLFMIYNRSPTTIWLDHLIEQRSASAGWGSQLEPKHWSAIIISDALFYLSCNYKIASGEIKRLNCAKAVMVCHMNNIKIKNQQSMNSNFWVGENMPLEKLMPYLQHALIKR